MPQTAEAPSVPARAHIRMTVLLTERERHDVRRALAEANETSVTRLFLDRLGIDADDVTRNKK